MLIREKKGMFSEKNATLAEKLQNIIKARDEQLAIIEENNQSIGQQYQQCLDEGISAQPLCYFEQDMILDAENELEKLGKLYLEIAPQYQNRIGKIPKALTWDVNKSLDEEDVEQINIKP
jgi:hypothetical protein